jgi:hypothetical protein
MNSGQNDHTHVQACKSYEVDGTKLAHSRQKQQQKVAKLTKQAKKRTIRGEYKQK